MASRFPLHLRPAMVRASRSLLRPDWVILRPAVPRAMGRAGCPPASQRLARKKGSRPLVLAVFFAARSLLGIGRSFSVGLSGFQTCLATADFGIAAGLSAAPVAGSDLAAVVVAADSAAAAVVVFAFVAAALASDPACFVCPVCPSAAAMGKGRVARIASCFLIPRSSLLRNHIFPSLLCFA